MKGNVINEVDIQCWLRYSCVLEGLGAFCEHKGSIAGHGAVWLYFGAEHGIGGHGCVLYCNNGMH